MKDSYRIVQPFVLTALWLLASLLSSNVIYAQTCVAPPSGLVSWWDGDAVSGTTAFDIQDGNDGTLVNGTTTASGIVGQAFSFDGIDDFISNPILLDAVGTTDFTIDMWAKIESIPENGHILRKNHGGTSRPKPFTIVALGRAGTTDFSFEIANIDDLVGVTASLAVAIPRSTIEDDKFHHLAFVREGLTLKIYVDGQLENSTTGTALVDINGVGDFCIGADCGGNQQPPIRGLIDEVEIFDRALSDTEIENIYSAGSAGKCKPGDDATCVAPPSGLVS